MKIVTGIMLGALIAMPVVGFADEVTNVTQKASVALGATYKSGNTEKSLFTLNLKGDRYSPKSDWINSLYTEYGKTQGDQTEGNARGQSDYRYKFGGNNLYGGVFGEGYYDDMKKIRTRLKIGPNMGTYFINEETKKLDASVGVNTVYERTSSSENSFAEIRLAGKYLWEVSETSSFYLTAEYSANAEDKDDGNGLFVTGLKSRVKANLSLFVELRDEYDNSPSFVSDDEGNADYNDVTVLAGLTYDFM